MKASLRFFVVGIICIAIAQLSRAQSSEGEAAALETLGAVSGVLIYNTYVVIGSMADGYEYEVYDSAQIQSYMDEQIGAMQNMVVQFQTLNDSGFLTDPDDKTFILDLIDACKLLKEEASSLMHYVQAKSDENGHLFQEDRTKAWEKVADLLGIE